MPVSGSKGNTKGVAPIRSGTGRATGTMIHKRGGKLTPGYPQKRRNIYISSSPSKSVPQQPIRGTNRKPSDRLFGGV